MKKQFVNKQFQFNANKTYVCDFETTTNNCNWYKQQVKKYQDDKSTPLVRLTYWYIKNLSGTEEYEGTNIETFIKQIKSFKGRHIQLYFHNLAFDGDFIYSFLSLYNPNKFVGIHFDDNEQMKIDGWEIVETKNTFSFRVKNGWYNLFQSGSKIMNITLGNHDGKHYQEISINCSLRLLSSSVAALGKSYGIPKMTKQDKEKGNAFYDVEPNDDLEQFKKDNANYVEYCKRDVEAVRLSLIDFKKTIDELPFVKEKNVENDRTNGVNICKYSTISSLGRDLMENVFVKGFQFGYQIQKNKEGVWELKMNGNKPYVDMKKQIKYRMNNKQKITTDGGLEQDISIGNMVRIDEYTHKMFDEPNYFVDEDGTIHKDVWDKYYRGGLTQYNPHFFNWENIGRSCKLDVSSAYPYHMTKPLPYGTWINEYDFWNNHYQEGWKEGVDYIEFVKVWVKKCTPNEMNKHCCVIPNWTNAKVDGFNKTYRKNPNVQENFVITTTRKEWDELQHWAEFEIMKEPDVNGKMVERIEKNYMYCAPFLEQISRILYDLKDYYSKKKDGGRKLSIKIFLNALYGSLALRTNYDNLYYVDRKDLDKIEVDKEYLVNNTQWNNEKEFKVVGYSPSRDFNNQVAVKMSYEKKTNGGFNKAAGAVITSYERVYLMETIREIGAEHFGYCDTDSILFVNLSKDKLKQLVKLSKSKSGLGSWEFEDNYLVKFKAVGAKKYRTISIPCDIDDEGNDIFYNFDEQGNKIFFDDANQAIEYAQKYNKWNVNSKIAGITQQDDNDSIFDYDEKELKDKNRFFEIMLSIYDKQDKTFKDNNDLDNDTLEMYYNNYVNKQELPIIAGAKTSMRVNGGRLLITSNKILQLNKQFT